MIEFLKFLLVGGMGIIVNYVFSVLFIFLTHNQLVGFIVGVEMSVLFNIFLYEVFVFKKRVKNSIRLVENVILVLFALVQGYLQYLVFIFILKNILLSIIIVTGLLFIGRYIIISKIFKIQKR
jgi:putative flippase GtrA